MSAQIYERVFVFGNGGVLGEADRVTIKWVGDPIPVATLVKDLGGFYPVPKHCVISVEMFHPSGTLAFNPSEKWLATETVTIKAQSPSGQTIESDGMIQAPTITSSPTDPAKWNFDVLCEAKAFK